MSNLPKVRDVELKDSSQVAYLALQLGYNCSEIEVSQNMQKYLTDSECRVIVAEVEGMLIGWSSLEIIRPFYSESYVELSGLVIDDKFRNRGIGKLLLSEAEKWAKQKGTTILRLNANAIRKDAHRFYENNGFVQLKEQIVYIKKI
jgi:GNAT superfamily N-acetyltransferase